MMVPIAQAVLMALKEHKMGTVTNTNSNADVEKKFAYDTASVKSVCFNNHNLSLNEFFLKTQARLLPH